MKLAADRSSGPRSPARARAAAACLASLLAACGPPVLADRDWRPQEIPSDCEVRVEHRDGTGTHTTVRHYDARGRLVSGTARPTYDGSAWERFAYDARGRLVAITSHEEQEGREGNCDVEGGCDEPALRALDRVDLAWDESGRLRRWVHRRDEYAEHKRKYVRKRTTTEERAYGYDGAGRLVTVESDDFSRTFEYDAAGRPVREIIEQHGNQLRPRAITHDDAGRIASYESLGHTSLYRYDEHGRVARRDVVGDSNVDHHETWEYDTRGAVTRHLNVHEYPRTERRTERARVFRYDDRGRLQEIHLDGAPQRIFTYAGACDAVKNAPRPPDPMGAVRCLDSPHSLLQTCW